MRTLVSASAVVLAVALVACSRSEAPPAPPHEPAGLPGVEAKPPPGPSPQAAARSAARVASVELGSALDASKRVVGPKTTFAPDQTIYASVATQGWEGPVELTARWTYEDGQVVNESTQTAQAGPGTTEFHIAKPSGWPAGTYQVEILADGASVATQRFEVR
jgi:hypothetical protein